VVVRATKHSLHLAKNKDYVMRTHTQTMMNMGNNNTKEDEHIQKVDHAGVIHNASTHVKEWRLIIFSLQKVEELHNLKMQLY
jgi:hypothetical protein